MFKQDYSVSPVITHAYGYDGSLVEELIIVILCLPHCKQMHMTHILLR